MMNYYRLMAGSLNTVNLAFYQPNYSQPQTKEIWTGANLVRDYINTTAYRENEDLTFTPYQVPSYHVICPLNTYF